MPVITQKNNWTSIILRWVTPHFVPNCIMRTKLELHCYIGNKKCINTNFFNVTMESVKANG